MKGVVVSEGVRWGAALAVCAIMLSVLGLTPALSWIPEIPLIGGALAVSVAILGWAGYCAAFRTGRVLAALFAGSLAGTIGGVVGGVAYLLYGKPALNIAVGLVAGSIAGAAVGSLAALLSRRR